MKPSGLLLLQAHLLVHLVPAAPCATRPAPVQSEMGERRSLLVEVLGREVQGEVSCQQEGVTRCTAVTSNPQELRALRAGARLQLLEGLPVEMEVRRDPTETPNGGFTLHLLLTDGGEGTVTVGPTGSMYGSIRPNTGMVIYAVEGCRGQGCNVLLERPWDYFNQFDD